jgi:hypothetical protein
MLPKITIFKITILMYFLFGITGHIVGGVMRYRVNKKMPQEAGIMYCTGNRWAIFKEYRDAYPGGKLHWLFWLSTAAALLCFLAWCIEIFLL